MQNISFPNILVSLVAGGLGAWLVVAGVIPVPERAGTRLSDTAPISEGEPLPETATPEEERVVAVVDRAAPAVVSIVITKDVPVVQEIFRSPSDPFGDFFSPFQFRVPEQLDRGTERRQVGGGSGFLVSSDGMIVTNRHVVSDTEADYTVFTHDGESHEARVIARDPINDIAIIKIEATNMPFLTFGDSEGLRAGQTVIAIGNALSEFQNSVSVGVVSGLSRSIVAGGGRGAPEQLEEVIQTDAAINPGNSGGPLLNTSGDVVGVNVAVALGSENIGFALPSNVVREVTEAVAEHGRIVRPYLGVRYTMVTPILAERNNLPVDYGALIVRGDTADELAVLPGSPANQAGLVEGDIILEIDGQRLTEENSLASIIRDKQVGDRLQLTVLHQGEQRQVEVTLTELPQ